MCKQDIVAAAVLLAVATGEPTVGRAAGLPEEDVLAPHSPRAMAVAAGAADPVWQGIARRAREMQLRLAGQTAAAKIGVRAGGTGWYGITGAALVAAGVDASLLAADPKNLQLYGKGMEQAIIIKGGEDGRLDAQDRIEFFGQDNDDYWSGLRIYWLVAGSRPGRRVEAANTGVGGQAGATAYFLRTEERRDPSFYFAALLNGDAPNFFGPDIAKLPGQQTLPVHNLALDGEPARLVVALQGVSFAPHRVTITLGDRALGAVEWKDRQAATAAFAVPLDLLHEGGNTVTFTHGSDADVSAVDVTRLVYPHKYATDSGTLLFEAPAGGAVRVEGFATADVQVFDVSQLASVRQIPVAVTTSGAGFAADIPASGAAAAGQSRKLMALTPDKALPAASITANRPSAWHEAVSSADLVIISHADFLAALGPLAVRRQTEGWKVAVVNVEDIYDEFSFGEKDPAAIRAFLSRTRSAWPHVPRAVLLVGDASFDPRNYLKKGSFDFVPTKLADIYDLETASDDWFVDFNDDGYPEIPIGRLPVRTAADAQAVVTKILGIAPKSPADLSAAKMLFLADHDSDPTLNFEAGVADIRTALPPAMPVTEIFRAITGVAGGRTALAGALADPPFIFDYVGHGTVEYWGGTWFKHQQLAGMWGPKPAALLVSTSCLNGFFHDVYTQGLNETMLLLPGNGVAAAIGSTTLAELADQVVLTRELFRLTLTGGRPLGQALLMAKSACKDQDVLRSYVLLGDPSQVLVAPAKTVAAVTLDTEEGPPPGAPAGGCRMMRARGGESAVDVGGALLLGALLLLGRLTRRTVRSPKF